MMAAEGLHDRGLIQKLDSLPQAGRLIHSLHSYMRFHLTLDNVLGDAFVDHAEGPLTQFSQNDDLFSRHLPFVLLVHCKHISGYIVQIKELIILISYIQKKLY